MANLSLHPGGEALTREAVKACGWKAGDRILTLCRTDGYEKTG